MPNDTIGHIACPTPDCGEQLEVKQTKRGKGRHLYSHCPDCGLNQGTGSKYQSWLYHNAIWLGETPEPPPNLIASKVVDKFKQPSEEPKPEPIEPTPEPIEPAPEPKADDSHAQHWLLGGAVTIGLLILRGLR